MGRIVPYAGLNGEFIEDDTYANGNTVHSTGGTALFATAGLNVGWDKWQLGAAYSNPINQNYSDGEVVAKQRFSIELNYFL